MQTTFMMNLICILGSSGNDGGWSWPDDTGSGSSGNSGTSDTGPVPHHMDLVGAPTAISEGLPFKTQPVLHIVDELVITMEYTECTESFVDGIC